KTFTADADTRIGDVFELTRGSAAQPLEPPASMGDVEVLKQIARSIPTYDSANIVPVLSPNNSESSLVQLMATAQSSIDIQQMTFDSRWGTPDSKSPLAVAAVNAARRGVRVRVLLNDE